MIMDVSYNYKAILITITIYGDSMSHTLTLKAFFFNRKTDYLPYYKNFTLTLAEDATAKMILAEIKAKNEDFSYPELNLVFKINDLVVEEDTLVSNIVEKLGTSLQIDPVNSYRSNNGLIINNDDFMKSYALLAPYASSEDKAYYKTLYALHYASETENFDREYIGDAILVLAHKMITDGSEHKEAILEAITSVHSGLMDCEYENNLFEEQDHTETINTLKDMLNNSNDEHPSLLDMIKSLFNTSETEDTTPAISSKKPAITIENLLEKQVAYYAGNNQNSSVQQTIDRLNMTSVTFPRSHKLSGVSILNTSKTLALTKAGITLLDAFDAGAEVLIVEDIASYTMFRDHFTAIENVIGRKMIGLELISSVDFIAQMDAI